MYIVRQGGQLLPWSEDDREALKGLREGQVVSCSLARQTNRNLEHHRLYWAGLLGLALDYWEPAGGMLSPNEAALLRSYTKYLERTGGVEGALQKPLKEFTARVCARRAEKVGVPHKSKAALHRWIKEELGLYDLEVTPAGVRKVLKSVSFARMDQSEFDEFYREAFSLIWRFVLSAVYASEPEAQDAVLVRLNNLC